MTYEEAMNLLENGVPVRREAWGEKALVVLNATITDMHPQATKEALDELGINQGGFFPSDVDTILDDWVKA